MVDHWLRQKGFFCELTENYSANTALPISTAHITINLYWLLF